MDEHFLAGVKGHNIKTGTKVDLGLWFAGLSIYLSTMHTKKDKDNK